MALQEDQQVQMYGVRAVGRVPGVLGAAPQTGHPTDAHGTVRLPGPLKFGPNILLMDDAVTKVAPTSLPMPAPLEDDTKKRVHVVTWGLGDKTPRTIDVAQGAVGDCPVASILAAMANTPAGSSRLSVAIKEISANVVTDLSAVMQYLDDDDWAARPKGSLASKRYFTVDLPKVKKDVTDVFYTNDGDENWDLLYIGHQSERSDKKAPPVLWPSVIEKAYAAVVGGYEKLNKIDNPVVAWDALLGLTPNVAQVADLTDPEIMKLAQSATNVPTIAATDPDRAKVDQESEGKLHGHHGYTVTGVAGNQIALYNPWGIPLNVSLTQFKKSFVHLVYSKI
ncbi:MAG TPA: C2 family cysteine protease [Terracidiphilus sp.]|nr:C2 family cysteine protease [Terracidiphilus sp.]